MNDGQIALTIMGSGAILGLGVMWLTGTKSGEKFLYKCVDFGEKIVDRYKSKFKNYEV